LLRRVIYVIEERTIGDLRAYGVSLDFAVKYLKGVVKEMGAEMELRRDLSTPATIPERLIASSRRGPRSSLDATRPWHVGMRGRAHRASYLTRRAVLALRERLRR
jgi:hypothetical protein